MRILIRDGVQYIDNGFRVISVHPIDLLYEFYSEHPRLQTFAKKGTTCLCCGLRGKKIVISQDKGGGIHVDLVSQGFKLMTRDHIVPSSKGGLDEINNYQPLCMKCNSRKSNRDITLMQLRLERAGFDKRAVNKYMYIAIML